MKPTRPQPQQPSTDETRAEIARRRLAQLAASFDADPPPRESTEPTHAKPRVGIPHVRVLATVAVAASVLLVWWLLSGRPEASDPVAPLAFADTPTAGSRSPGPSDPSASPSGGPADGEGTQELIVDVVGKVRTPGIVTVPVGSRVYEAVEAAGGLKGRVDTDALNMARELVDGEQILVGIEPVQAAGPPPATGSGAVSGGAAAPGAKVNLNTATVEQLDTLPGVGPVTAQAILTWREDNGGFGSVDDLLDVKGIGDATLAELRDLVVV